MNNDRAAVLEAIAFGSDRSIRPAERLRAIELLSEMTGDADLDFELFRRTQSLDGEQLQSEQDSLVAALLGHASADELRMQWPRTSELLERRIEERVRELTQSLGAAAARAQFVVERAEPAS